MGYRLEARILATRGAHVGVGVAEVGGEEGGWGGPQPVGEVGVGLAEFLGIKLVECIVWS